VNTERTIEILVLGYPGTSGQRPTMSAHYVVLGEKNLEWGENATIATSSDAPIEQVDLLACVKALELLRHREVTFSVSRVVVETNSAYVLYNIGRALFDWPRRKWLERDGSSVPHANQWKKLLLEMGKTAKRVEFKKARTQGL
jgi:ribonuclease HI